MGIVDDNLTVMSTVNAKQINFVCLYIFDINSDVQVTYFVSSFGFGINLTQSRFWKFASIQLRGECCEKKNKTKTKTKRRKKERKRTN